MRAEEKAVRRCMSSSLTLFCLFGLAFPLLLFYFIFLRFYLFMIDTEREAETQAEGEAGSM